MAKEKTPFAGHIPKLYAYMKQAGVTPAIIERYTGEDWVFFGQRNLWPEQMRLLADNCAPLEASAQMLSRLIAGKGLTFHSKDGSELPEAQRVFDTWMMDTTQEDFLNATAYDIAMFNGLSWVPRRSSSDIVRLDHLDVMRLRSGELRDDGKPDTFYWCANWAKRSRLSETTGRFKVRSLPRYRGDVAEAEAILYTKTYKQGQDVYAIPWWTGIIKAAEVWTSVDAYNKAQIDTGFSASVHLHTFTNKDESALDKYDEKVMNAYSGSMGRGIFHTYGTPEEGSPQITVLPRGNHAGELDEIRTEAANVIYAGYGMPKILMGADASTGMDGAANAIRQAHQTVLQMLVIPKQQMITKTLVRLMNDVGLKDVWECRIDQIDLVNEGQDEVLGRQATMAAMTKNEYRERVLDLEPLEGDDWNGPLNGGDKTTDAAASNDEGKPSNA